MTSQHQGPLESPKRVQAPPPHRPRSLPRFPGPALAGQNLPRWSRPRPLAPHFPSPGPALHGWPRLCPQAFCCSGVPPLPSSSPCVARNRSARAHPGDAPDTCLRRKVSRRRHRPGPAGGDRAPETPRRLRAPGGARDWVASFAGGLAHTHTDARAHGSAQVPAPSLCPSPAATNRMPAPRMMFLLDL